MEDALIFYWVSWMLWIVFTFICRKGKRRLFLSFIVLLMINLSSTEIFILNYQVNLSWLVIFGGAVLLLASLNHNFLTIVGSLCLAFGYTGLLFWEQVSPVWMFLSRNLMIPVMSILFLSLLSNHLLKKCAVWGVGLCGGEMLHSIILHNYGMKELVGEPAFQDLLLAGIAANIVFSSCLAVKNSVDIFIHRLETKLKVRWNYE